ncbi:hypothetical protein AAY23_11833, partial [Frankia casuarinae]
GNPARLGPVGPGVLHRKVRRHERRYQALLCNGRPLESFHGTLRLP